MDFQTRYVFDPKTDLLGKGGFSKVYKANDTLLERTVALKFFTAKAADKYQILNEIKKVIRFEHPNLCKYYDVALLTYKNVLEETEQMEVGIMEYIDAGDFKSFTKQHPHHTDKLLIDVLKGLAYLHKHGMAHRDLKPQNILIKMVDDEPVAKITDFGISKLIDTDDAHSSALLGTIEYMAPEQFNPKKYGVNSRITTNLDLWSFGLLVYDTILHESFFGSRSSGISAEQVMSNILSDASLEKADALPPKYREIVKRCLVKNASERVQNAMELIPLFQVEEETPYVIPSRVGTTTGPVALEETQVLAAAEAQPEEETVVLRDIPEEAAEETVVLEYEPVESPVETVILQQIADEGEGSGESTRQLPQFEAEETQVFAPSDRSFEATEILERPQRETEEETQFLPVSGNLREETAVLPERNVPIREETFIRTEEPKLGKINWPGTSRPKHKVRKVALLSSAAILVLLFLVAYAFLEPSDPPVVQQAPPPAPTPVAQPKINAPQMVAIDGGTFLMGDADRNIDNPALPAHQVTLSPFSIGKYEVTVAQFRDFVTDAKYVTTAEQKGFSEIYSGGAWRSGQGVNWRHDVHGKPVDTAVASLPVVHVSWMDATEYCKWLSKKGGGTYRLPTEAEWEYAARGGSRSGDNFFSGGNVIEEVAWYKGNSGNSIHPVGQKKGNELELFDMSGNAIEWCYDSFDKDFYRKSQPQNPLNSDSALKKVVRGGAWGGGEAYCRTTYRYRFDKDVSGGTIGFRVCKVSQ